MNRRRILSTMCLLGGLCIWSCAHEAHIETIASGSRSAILVIRIGETSADTVVGCVERPVFPYSGYRVQLDPEVGPQNLLWMGTVRTTSAIEDPLRRVNGEPVRSVFQYRVMVEQEQGNSSREYLVTAVAGPVQVNVGDVFWLGPHGCRRAQFQSSLPTGWESELYLRAVSQCVRERGGSVSPAL